MSENTQNYYDVEIDISKVVTEGGMVDDVFYLQDLKQRKLFLTDEISQYTVGDIVKHILQFNHEDRGCPAEDRKPILLYIASNGGEVDPGFELIDAIMCSKTPVYTINLGYQYSMGFLIGLAGHKRYAFSHSKYLMHDGSNFVFNSGAKAQDQMEFNRKVEERVKQYILLRSKLTSEEYDSKLRVEWYLFGNEAKEKGFVDYIVGVDCDIDDVV